MFVQTHQRKAPFENGKLQYMLEILILKFDKTQNNSFRTKHEHRRYTENISEPIYQM